MTSRFYATFAREQEPHGPGVVRVWILKDSERWHDAVRGDGISYSPDGPADIESLVGETEAQFRRRVNRVLDKWDRENE